MTTTTTTKQLSAHNGEKKNFLHYTSQPERHIEQRQ
jgi:hypothetical protein